MNEWALPTVSMEGAICKIVDKLKEEGLWIPELVVTGGFASEDQVFKALAFGLRHFAALNRKFDLQYIDRSDLIPLTREIKELY
jgi:hypothetical protein